MLSISSLLLGERHCLPFWFDIQRQFEPHPDRNNVRTTSGPVAELAAQLLIGLLH